MIGAGGTGGHVYPALTAAEALSRQNAPDLVFVGTRGGGGFERQLVEAADVAFRAFEEVFAGPIVGVGLLRAAYSAGLMGIGTLQALALLARHRPQAILLTGGWANVPLACAAWLARIPMLVYLPDIEPGRTIQWLSKVAQQVAITVPDSAQYFRPGQTLVTGYPLRASVRAATRAAALARFNLDPARKTLLVFGGSRGARSINQAVTQTVPQLLDLGLQILHISGKLDWENVAQARAQLPDVTHYQVFDYLEADMGLALAAADVVLARAGASVLGEFPYFGLAALLVPYPYAWRYQKTNADYLAARGAAIRLEDERLAAALLPTLATLMRQPERLAAMQAAARALAVPDGAERLAAALVALAAEPQPIHTGEGTA